MPDGEYRCFICGKPPELSDPAIVSDDDGHPVHMDCYSEKLAEAYSIPPQARMSELGLATDRFFAIGKRINGE